MRFSFGFSRIVVWPVPAGKYWTLANDWCTHITAARFAHYDYFSADGSVEVDLSPGIETMHIILFTAPNTCAKVPLILLEEIGATFETRLIRHMRGEHKSVDFKKFNPKGKVPAIVVDGETLTENVAIISYLDQIFPEASLLPQVGRLDRARQIADLCFCSATLHPFVTRICVPQFFADPECVPSLQRWAKEGVAEYLQIIEDRLGEGPWWYGNTWSAMDPYLYWIFWRIQSGSDFDTTRYPLLTDHSRRLEQRPAVQRALAREAIDRAILEAEGLIPKRPQFD